MVHCATKHVASSTTLAPSTPRNPSGDNTEDLLSDDLGTLSDAAYKDQLVKSFERTMEAHLPKYQVPNSVKAKDSLSFLKANPGATRKDFIHPSEKEDCVQPELFKKEVCKAFLDEYPDIYYQFADIFCDLDVSIHAVKRAMWDTEAWKEEVRAHIKGRYKGGFEFGSFPLKRNKSEPRPTTGKFVITPEQILVGNRAERRDSVGSVASHYRKDYTADLNERRESGEMKSDDTIQPEESSKRAFNTDLDLRNYIVPANFGPQNTFIYGNTYSQPEYPAPTFPLPPIPTTKGQGNDGIKPKTEAAIDGAAKKEDQPSQTTTTALAKKEYRPRQAATTAAATKEYQPRRAATLATTSQSYQPGHPARRIAMEPRSEYAPDEGSKKLKDKKAMSAQRFDMGKRGEAKKGEAKKCDKVDIGKGMAVEEQAKAADQSSENKVSREDKEATKSGTGEESVKGTNIAKASFRSLSSFLKTFGERKGGKK